MKALHVLNSHWTTLYEVSKGRNMNLVNCFFQDCLGGLFKQLAACVLRFNWNGVRKSICFVYTLFVCFISFVSSHLHLLLEIENRMIVCEQVSHWKEVLYQIISYLIMCLYLQGQSRRVFLSCNEFINNKLAAKVFRQLQGTTFCIHHIMLSKESLKAFFSFYYARPYYSDYWKFPCLDRGTSSQVVSWLSNFFLCVSFCVLSVAMMSRQPYWSPYSHALIWHVYCKQCIRRFNALERFSSVFSNPSSVRISQRSKRRLFNVFFFTLLIRSLSTCLLKLYFRVSLNYWWSITIPNCV